MNDCEKDRLKRVISDAVERFLKEEIGIRSYNIFGTLGVESFDDRSSILQMNVNIQPLHIPRYIRPYPPNNLMSDGRVSDASRSRVVEYQSSRSFQDSEGCEEDEFEEDTIYYDQPTLRRSRFNTVSCFYNFFFKFGT